VCEEFLRMLSIPSSNIFSPDYFNTGVYDVTISRDKEKFPALLSLLKTRRFKDVCQSMIIYTESKKSADELAKMMTDSGYKVSVLQNLKNEASHQKVDGLPKLIKSYQGIVISVSNSEIGVERGFANCVVHYSVPKNLELYIEEITGLKDQVVSHLFLNKNDYVDLRLSIQDEMVEKEQLKALVGKIFEANKESNQNSKNFNMEIERDREMLVVKVSEFCQAVDLKKELIVQIFEMIQESSNWLEFYGVMPATCSLKIMPGKEEQAMENPLIQLLTEDVRKDSGIYEFVIPEKALDLKCSVNEVTKALKNLMSDHIIHYDMGEAFSFKLIMDPNPMLIEQTLDDIYLKIHNKNIINLQKLDLMFAISKVNSVKTHRHLQIKSEKIPRSPNTFIPKSPNTYLESSTREYGSATPLEESKGKTSFTDFFEKYLNFREDVNGGYDGIWDHSSSIRNTVPLVKVHTQREKSNLFADITPLVNSVYDEVSLMMNEEVDIDQIGARVIRSVVRIMQGLEIFSLNTDWKR